jgi:beta-glucosidase-like glycosyl hydrolase
MWRVLLFLPFLLCADWAEETLSTMTLEEKVGQLLIAPACPLRESDHWADWMRLMAECHVGNALVKQSDPESQIRFLNALQGVAKFPLLVAADYEWGLAMTMQGAMAFPRNQTLGERGDLSLIFDIGREIARQARLVGVHLNLAPVADVNNNPDNQIIGTRSFGDDPALVASCVSAYLRGFQSTGLLACAKHFPGHGDTSVDSHSALPLIPHSFERLEQIEFVPFRKAIEEGVAVIMAGHLLVPSLDAALPATLSRPCLTGCLRNTLGFKGLIVSDALNMKALTLSYSPEEIALRAREAGCDLLLYGAHRSEQVDDLMQNQIPRAFRALLFAYKEGRLDLEELDQSVLKILQAKEKLGLHRSRQIPEGVLLDLQKLTGH